MKAAYVDTSWIVAIAFAEKGYERLVRSLRSYDVILSSNLLEAEIRSSLQREQVAEEPEALLSGISWIFPDRTLRDEMAAILKAGHVRGADLWHLAVAMYVDPACEIDFLTLDARQKQVSRTLGFGGG